MKRTILILLAMALLLTGCAAGTETPPAPASQSADAEPPAATETPVRTETLALTETPSPTPSPTPTPAPTATPTPSPTPTPITDEILSSGAFDSFFNDALFIGDSITATYKSYCTGERNVNPGFLGTARFLAATSYNIRLALYNTPLRDYLIFRGIPVSITQGINQAEAKWVYILLGVNDMAGKEIEQNIEKYGQLIDLIKEQCPGVTLVIQSLTPVSRGFARKRGIDMAQWNSFNEPLQALCEEKGVFYLDIATALQDADGYLPDSLSSDQEFHFNREGNDLWTLALRRFAMQQMGTGGAEYIPVWPAPTPEPIDTPAPEDTTATDAP